MSDKLPIGVRIYEFIKGADFPLIKGGDKVGPTRIVKEGEKEERAGGESNRAGMVDAAEKKALGYAEGGKVQKVMHEYKHGQLHSGSQAGPKVTNRSQALAIALSEARKASQGGYAGGGAVQGPGTSTSDSVPIQASNGEYVIPAEVVSYLGTKFFDDLVAHVATMQQSPAPGTPPAPEDRWSEMAADEMGGMEPAGGYGKRR